MKIVPMKVGGEARLPSGVGKAEAARGIAAYDATGDERAGAEACGCSVGVFRKVVEARDEVGVPRELGEAYLREVHEAHMREMLPLVDKAQKVALERVVEAMPSASARDATVAFGILVDKGAIMAGLVGAGEDVGAYGMSEEESEAILLRALGRVRERREVLEVDAEVVDGE